VVPVLCETEGHDIILIATVGVGQSETLVTEITEMYLLLLPPTDGDGLQDIKWAIVETTHLIVVNVNKTDGDMVMVVRRSGSYYKSALQMMYRVTVHKEEDVSGGESEREKRTRLCVINCEYY
jgi:LAO/AO transport system kinase